MCCIIESRGGWDERRAGLVNANHTPTRSSNTAGVAHWMTSSGPKIVITLAHSHRAAITQDNNNKKILITTPNRNQKVLKSEKRPTKVLSPAQKITIVCLEAYGSGDEASKSQQQDCSWTTAEQLQKKERNRAAAGRTKHAWFWAADANTTWILPNNVHYTSHYTPPTLL